MERARLRLGRGRGQIVALFAISGTVIILSVGLVIDGGNALVQRRVSQNASDFAALAGARIVATWIEKDFTNGTDANVVAALNSTVAANGGSPLTYGSPDGPAYVSDAGADTGFVSSGTIPTGTVGVRVNTSRSFRPFLLGIVGINGWTASSSATARGGYQSGAPESVFPVGIAQAFFETYPFCIGEVGSSAACTPVRLTPGNLNVPGGFGWLKFGCSAYGLGQSGGCGTAASLQGEIGPPGNSYGCCTEVRVSGADKIGSLPGNQVSANCDYYIQNKIVVTVPVWDYSGGTHSDAWYHIVGFAGFQLTACPDGRNIQGVWRKQFSVGPTTATAAPFSNLSVQLVR